MSTKCQDLRYIDKLDIFPMIAKYIDSKIKAIYCFE